MIDFHSHILPGIDDGSKCLDDTLWMLKSSASQGVETMGAGRAVAGAKRHPAPHRTSESSQKACSRGGPARTAHGGS